MRTTADHGNAEMMTDPETHQPHTAHTLNPVPVIVVDAKAADASTRTLRDGRLADVAPTLLEMLGLPQPAEMTGRSLIVDRPAALRGRLGKWAGMLALPYDVPSGGWCVLLRVEQLETVAGGGKPEKTVARGPLGAPELLRLIDELGLAGFFLLHHEVLELARECAVEVRGRDRDHVLAFARVSGRDAVVVAVGRRFAPLSEGGRRWPAGWEAELAARLAERNLSGAAREIREVERISRDALQQVREAVGGYRAGGLKTELANARAALSSAHVGVEEKVNALELPAIQDSLLAMVLREAVTNVIRHADARHCHIELDSHGQQLHMVVSDDGHGGNLREGNGLRGMRERLQKVAGRLDITSNHEGTRLSIQMPLKPGMLEGESA